MIKIGITGGSFNGNTGAEAMLVTTIARLREQLPDVKFGVFSPYYSDDHLVFENCRQIRLYNFSPLYLAFFVFPLSIVASLFKHLGMDTFKVLFPKEIQFLWNCDLIVDIAGVSFIDGREKFLPYNVLSIYPGFLFKTPVVKYAQAIGPNRHPLNRLLARRCLSKCQHLFARGEKTLSFLKELRLPDQQFSPSSDIAFVHQINDSLAVGYQQKDKDSFQSFMDKNSRKPVIGICPSSVLSKGEKGRDYLDHITSLINLLGEKGFNLVLFPNATKSHRPRTSRNNDLPLLAELKKRVITRPNCHFIESDLNSSDVREIIRKLDLTVVSRFHAMIFSLLEETPPVIISWSHKYKEVMDQFELGHHVIDHQSMDPEQLSYFVSKLMEQSSQVIDCIKKHLPEIQAQARQQIDYAVELIEK